MRSVFNFRMSSIAFELVYSLKVPFRIARHFLLFAGMNLMFTWVIYIQANPALPLAGAARIVFINSLFFFGYAYVTAYLLVPFFISVKRYGLFIVSFIAVGFLISWIKFVFSETIFYMSIGESITTEIQRFNLPKILMNTKDMTFIVALFLIAKFTRDNLRIRKRINELHQHQLNSELRLLRNQLDPHVIFNNLNNIYCLSLNSKDTAGLHLRQLHAVLSYYFREQADRPVPLQKEIDAIRAFVSLEQLRYGSRLSIDFSFEGDIAEKKIFPFVFFSYIENWFTQGCLPDSGDAWVRIYIKAEKDSVTFHSSNIKSGEFLSGSRSDQMVESENKFDTLRLLYPDRHTIQVDDQDDSYTVDIRIDI